MNQSVPLRLSGVDHTARPTWKLRETIEFYRDTLGLPLVHTISARGRGPRATRISFIFSSIAATAARLPFSTIWANRDR